MIVGNLSFLYEIQLMKVDKNSGGNGTEVSERIY